jgi:acetyl-CoA acyltransferase
LKAQSEGKFDSQIVPITIEQTFLNENGKKETKSYVVNKDEGLEPIPILLGKLKPVSPPMVVSPPETRRR